MPAIRSATPSDIPNLCALMRQYYAHDHLEFDEVRAKNALHTLLREARRGYSVRTKPTSATR
jgi:hypothetical protein